MILIVNFSTYISFKAYAAGCNIVLLAPTFERVQIIPGAVHDYIRITAIDCSSDTGKIAAAYDNTVCIYEPTPLISNNSSHVSGNNQELEFYKRVISVKLFFTVYLMICKTYITNKINHLKKIINFFINYYY